MKIEQAKKLFSENIKKYLKRRNLKQLYIATLLDVTPSAVSQMIKCSIFMSQSQLKTVSKGLHLAPEETLEMQTLLANIRNGEGNIKTPFNKLLRSLRREQKFSIAKLSTLTGISRVRLKSFEEELNVIFSEDDAERLSKIYGCSADFLLKKNRISAGSMEYLPEERSANSVLKFSDSEGAYQSQQKIPVVKLNDLINYQESVDIFVFGTLRCYEEMLYDSDKQLIGVSLNAEELDFPFPAETVLMVTARKPLIYVCRLFLCMDSSRKFHILRKIENKDEFYAATGEDQDKPFAGKIRWSLGIVEIRMTPKLLV